MSSKQRNSERVRIYLPARWEVASGAHEGTVADISVGGCFILTGGEASAGEPVALQIELPSHGWVRLSGRVVYTAREIGFGLCFVDTAQGEREAIARLISEVRGGRADPEADALELGGEGGAMPHENGMPTYEELSALPEDELRRRIDEQFAAERRDPDPQVLAYYYREELVRREQHEATRAMLEYTRQVTSMTQVILWLTLVNVAVSAILVFMSLR